MTTKNPIQKKGFQACCGADILWGFQWTPEVYDQKTNKMIKNPMALEEAVKDAVHHNYKDGRGGPGTTTSKGITLAILNPSQIPTYEKALLAEGFVVLVPAFKNTNTSHILTLYAKFHVPKEVNKDSRTAKQKEDLRKFIFDAKDY